MEPWQATRQQIEGLLIGSAVGDSLGLPMEGLSRGRQQSMFTSSEPKQRLLFGHWGMVSDDTEHAFMVAQAFHRSAGEPQQFRRQLAKRLRWWLLSLPAGAGSATLRSIIKLWLGVSPANSGIRSAGNGPVMRSPLLGLLGKDEQHVAELVEISTTITHRDPRAQQGALLCALVARWAAQQVPTNEILARAQTHIHDPQLQQRWQQIQISLDAGDTPVIYTDNLGLQTGITGFINDTVPVAVYTWLYYRQDPRQALAAGIRLGGDTDTVAALIGAFLGAENGSQAFPAAWQQLADYLSVSKLQQMAVCLTDEQRSPPKWWWPLRLLRNLFFLAVVLVWAGWRLVKRW